MLELPRATPRVNIEIFNQNSGGQENIFGHQPNQTLVASSTGPHHTLASSGVGANLLIGGSGTNVFSYKSNTTWPGYAAQNVGDPGNPGTNLTYSLSGYQQNKDVFRGQAGAVNILWMSNGNKALFLDDGFSPGVSALRLENITEIQLGVGNQIVDLTSTVYALGNVTLRGGTGKQVMLSSVGDDLIITGKGAETIWGGSGNDTVLYTRVVSRTYIDDATGANGVDTLKVKLTAAEYTNAVKAELQAYHNFIADPSHNGQSFQFVSLGKLKATGFERLDVNVAGAHVDVVAQGAKQTIHGDVAGDIVSGGTGQDTFFWATADVAPGDNADHVTNFSFQQYDRIDVSRLLDLHNPASVGDVARTIDTTQGTLIQVHVHGSTDWTDVAVLDGIHGVSARDLWHSHSLIL